MQILSELLISVKLRVLYRVDKDKRIQNDKYTSIFTSSVLSFSGEKCKYLYYSREEQRALGSSLMLKGKNESC